MGIDKSLKKGHPKIAFVEFEDDSVAEELTTKGKIDFEDKKLEIKSYKQYKRRFRHISANVLNIVDTIDALSQAPAPDSPNNILNVLNDDCLRAIFGKLHFSTLNAVVNVCIRFNRVAKKVFKTKYHLKTINILDLEWDRHPTVSQTENFLSNFGDVISSISMFKDFSDSRKNEDATIRLKMISKYCMNLNSLEFDCINICDKTLYEIVSLLKRLKKLKIHKILGGLIFVILTESCYALETLELSFTMTHMTYINHAFFSLPKIALPNLVEVRILSMISENSSFCLAIGKFIELHFKLKTLKIQLCDDYKISKNCRLYELNELDVDIFGPPALQSLQQTLSTQNVEIENLKLVIRACDINIDFLNTISQFKHINTLDISVVFDFNDLNLLLKTLPHLKTLALSPRRGILFDRHQSESITTIIKVILQHENELTKLTFDSFHLKKRYPFDEANYYNILESVKNRNTYKLTITCRFRTNLPRKNVEKTESIYILNMVPDLLTIEQQIS